MSFTDLEASFDNAKRRLDRHDRESSRRSRSDRGIARLPPEVVEEVERLAGGQEKPRMTDLLAQIGRFCEMRRLSPPSRTTIYRLLERITGHKYEMASLPHDARLTLHNVDPSAPIPGAQIAFHCFNYGNSRAMSFAAGLPWLDLLQARRKRGWRSKSRGVLEAVCRARGI